jgi:AcrR family transcriptional regulator
MARTRAQDYEEKRAAILKGAAALFAERGYAGASVKMIADACGISKALLYHYYPDKEAVLFDILDAHLRGLVREVEGVEASSAQGPRDHLEALCGALLEAYRDADAEHQVQLVALRLLPDERQEALKALERRLVEIFSQAIAAVLPDLAQRPQLLKPLTMSLFGMLNWHYLWFREGRGMTRGSYAGLVADIVEAGGARQLQRA